MESTGSNSSESSNESCTCNSSTCNSSTCDKGLDLDLDKVGSIETCFAIKITQPSKPNGINQDSQLSKTAPSETGDKYLHKYISKNKRKSSSAKGKNKSNKKIKDSIKIDTNSKCSEEDINGIFDIEL